MTVLRHVAVLSTLNEALQGQLTAHASLTSTMPKFWQVLFRAALAGLRQSETGLLVRFSLGCDLRLPVSQLAAQLSKLGLAQQASLLPILLHGLAQAGCQSINLGLHTLNRQTASDAAVSVALHHTSQGYGLKHGCKHGNCSCRAALALPAKNRLLNCDL